MQHRQLYMLRPNADVAWPARFGADGGWGGVEAVEGGGGGAIPAARTGRQQGRDK